MAVINIATSYGSDIASILAYIRDFPYTNSAGAGDDGYLSYQTVDSDFVTFHGTGFTFDAEATRLTGGTVTEIDINLNEVRAATITGVVLDVVAAEAAFKEGPDALLALFGDTTLVGGSGRDHIALGGGDDDLRLGAGDDDASGGAGNDIIDGGVGADTMTGGAGNDTYVVDDARDVVVESGGGVDEVRSSISWSLSGKAIENLTLTGDALVNATGNGLANHLIGNVAANVLDGGVGADTMEGGAGNDTYVVDNAKDVVKEAGGGKDLVKSSVSFSLAGQSLENLTLTGTASTHGDGNSSANVIIGNSAANQLDGGLANDTLTGGAGHDYFLFDTALGASNVDRITDFSVADDTIRLGHGVFTGLKVGTLSSSAFHIGAAAGDTTDRIIYDDATGKLFFDDDGTGGHAAKQFATITAHLALTNADFVVV